MWETTHDTCVLQPYCFASRRNVMMINVSIKINFKILKYETEISLKNWSLLPPHILFYPSAVVKE